MSGVLKRSTRPLEQTTVFQHMNFAPPTQMDPDSVMPVSSGQLLASKRRELGISAAEMAFRLKLSEKQIRALEAGDFAVLPEAAYIRAFARAYAKALYLDESLVTSKLHEELDEYQAQIKGNQKQTRTRRSQGLGEFKSDSKGASTIMSVLTPRLNTDPFGKGRNATSAMSVTRLLGVLMLILAVGGVIALNSGWLTRYGITAPQLSRTASEVAIAPPAPANSATTVSEVAPTVSTLATEVTPSTDSVSTNPAATAALPAAGTDGATVAPGMAISTTLSSQPVTTATVTTPVPPSDIPAVMPTNISTATSTVPVSNTPDSGATVMVLKFSGDSWISIKNAEGKDLAYGLFQAGSEKVISEPGPYKLVLGNASNISMTYKGQAYDLNPFVKGAVAKLKLD
ncbi:helix-turn-helix domain-containing protein [Ampullimonas aquatilis]|uniref:helix-turn-helix domain-containing protein n=1 Tax=Ampullimonas aquatilis TaxID=1341549 RepID=UPI003C76464A